MSQVRCNVQILSSLIKSNSEHSVASKLSTDYVHIIKLPDVGSVLSSVHALDQSAHFVFAILLTILCGKFDVNESLGRSLEMCSTDIVVSQFQWFPFVLKNSPTS